MLLEQRKQPYFDDENWYSYQAVLKINDIIIQIPLTTDEFLTYTTPIIPFLAWMKRKEVKCLTCKAKNFSKLNSRRCITCNQNPYMSENKTKQFSNYQRRKTL